ncbi:hypothetical protein G6O69_19435 [Pseudenhygromyxa sp. WMMC2535]|uniref:hypothetical protein n=1 Tax=Pseudenhygromyxa sp. WMMC2535 TaxID=2712867 RepID=UPI001554DDA8|nr:hypothetical protein [Pseudenhygromyxa sp. WMMC2535]NVB40027.1 hypothetical protein [Pseudenhygromyxa sp. WMMC2535]
MNRRAASLLTLALSLALGGCDFFQELESLPGAEETDTGDDDDTDGDDDDTSDDDDEACTVLDDYCADQDSLWTCDYDSGELVNYDCASVCGTSLNVTCTPTESFQHACWCTTPGSYKNKSCSELEACLTNCGDPATDCAAACFASTTAQTARLFGSLYSCADLACDAICASSPDDCGSCLVAARAGLWGDCGVERSVCDADATDEPSWP